MMSGKSWRGPEDPATARAKAFEQVQVLAARVESAQKRLDVAKREKLSADCELTNAETAYEEARKTLEELMPTVRESPEMHPA